MDDVITLVAETQVQNASGIFTTTETTRDVFARISSVSRAEFFNAGLNGLQPSLVATTPRINWGGEKIAVYKNVRYAVYRTFFPDDSDDVELYLEARAGVTLG